MKAPQTLLWLIFWTTILICGCSGTQSSDPVSPSNPSGDSKALAQVSSPDTNNHYLWGYYLVRIDLHDLSSEIIPIRIAASHMNVLNFLEKGQCTDCLKLSGAYMNSDGTLKIDISIKHPFSNKNLTGFDVRGIAMFNGSHQFPASGLVMSDRTVGEGDLVNPDGFTTLYNPTTVGHGLEGYIKGKLATAAAPTSTLNGYRRFISSDPANTRNAFYAGDEVKVMYQLDMPDKLAPWVFGYAVDASWAPPVNKPVDDPITDFGSNANCPEAWKIDVHDLGPGLSPQSNTTELQIDVYDHQGKDSSHLPFVECPELFDGDVQATWVEDGTGFTRYSAEIGNTKSAPDGAYRLLVSLEAAENDPSAKPWLDISAYQTLPVYLGEVPAHPVDVTPPWLNFSPEAVTVAGNYAYVAGGYNGFHIFDISDPTNPIWISKIDTLGEAQAVVVSGDYAYVAYGYAGLLIIDITSPDSPAIVKTVHLPGFGDAMGIAVLNGYVCVAAFSEGLQLIDVDPPDAAYIVKSVDTPDYAVGVSVSDGYAYVADASGGLQIIDIDPADSAYIVNSVALPSDAWAITVSDGYAYVADEYSGLQIIDIDPPESASVVKSIDEPYAVDVAVSGGYACVTSGYSLEIVDIDPIDSASVVKSLEIWDDTLGICFSNGYIYAASGSAGLQVIDVSPPDTASIVKMHGTPGHAKQVDVSNGQVYVANWDAGLAIVNAAIPENASWINSVDTSDDACGVAVSNGYAYVGDDLEGLHLIDVDPPESGHIVKSVDILYAGDVAVSNGYAYVADEHAGLKIVDIDPPESAYVVKTVNTPGNAWGVAVLNGMAYVTDWKYGLQIIDVDPLDSAHIVKQVDTPGTASDVTVSGGYAYVADDDSGLQIIDVDPPESASIVKSFATSSTAECVVVSNGYAYVAVGTSGLQIFDIDPLDSASVVSSIETHSYATGVSVSDGIAYVADLYGLRIIKLY